MADGVTAPHYSDLCFGSSQLCHLYSSEALPGKQCKQCNCNYFYWSLIIKIALLIPSFIFGIWKMETKSSGRFMLEAFALELWIKNAEQSQTFVKLCFNLNIALPRDWNNKGLWSSGHNNIQGSSKSAAQLHHHLQSQACGMCVACVRRVRQAHYLPLRSNVYAG